MRQAKRSVCWVWAILLIASVQVVYGISASIDMATDTVTVTYVEPTTLVGGKALKDLIYTTIYPYLQSANGEMAPLSPIQIPASGVGGGGAIQHAFQITKPDAGYHFVIIKVTATREVGVESHPSRIDFVLSGRNIP